MTAQIINRNQWIPECTDTLQYFGTKDNQLISTTNQFNSKESSLTNIEYAQDITLNDTLQANQYKQQKSSFDILIDNKIRGILNGIIKNQQKQQQLNFISVCKTMNKTYDNKDKLTELANTIIKQEERLAYLVVSISILTQRIEKQKDFSNDMCRKLIDDNNKNLNIVLNKLIKLNNISNTNDIAKKSNISYQMNQNRTQFKELMSELNNIKNIQLNDSKLHENIVSNQNKHGIQLNKLKHNQIEYDKNIIKQIDDIQKLSKKQNIELKEINEEYKNIMYDHQNDALSTSIAVQSIKNEIKELKHDLETNNNKNKSFVIEYSDKINNNKMLEINNTNIYKYKQLDKIQNQISNIQSNINSFISGFQTSLEYTKSLKQTDHKQLIITQKLMMKNIDKIEKHFNELNVCGIEKQLIKISQINNNTLLTTFVENGLAIFNQNSIDIEYINGSIDAIKKQLYDSMILNNALNNTECKEIINEARNECKEYKAYKDKIMNEERSVYEQRINNLEKDKTY